MAIDVDLRSWELAPDPEDDWGNVFAIDLGRWKPELHPRDSKGRFRDKWGLSPAAMSQVERLLAGFRPPPLRSDRHASSYLRQHRGPRSKRQQDTLDYFLSREGNEDIQSTLRTGYDPRRDKEVPSSERIRELEGMMQPLEHDLILSRVMGPDAFGLPPERMSEVEEWTGQRVQDLGFSPMNVGSPHQIGAPHVEMRVLVPRGTRAIIVGDGGDGPNSRTVILDRQQPVRLGKIQSDGRGGFYVMATVAPASEPGSRPVRNLSGRELPVRDRSSAVEATPEEFQRRGMEVEAPPGPQEQPDRFGPVSRATPTTTVQPPPGRQPLGPTTPAPEGAPLEKTSVPAGEVPTGAGRVTQPGDENIPPPQREVRPRTRGQGPVMDEGEARIQHRERELARREAQAKADQARADRMQDNAIKRQERELARLDAEVQRLRAQQEADREAQTIRADEGTQLRLERTDRQRDDRILEADNKNRRAPGWPNTGEDTRIALRANQIRAARGMEEMDIPEDAPPPPPETDEEAAAVAPVKRVRKAAAAVPRKRVRKAAAPQAEEEGPPPEVAQEIENAPRRGPIAPRVISRERGEDAILERANGIDPNSTDPLDQALLREADRIRIRRGGEQAVPEAPTPAKRTPRKVAARKAAPAAPAAREAPPEAAPEAEAVPDLNGLSAKQIEEVAELARSDDKRRWDEYWRLRNAGLRHDQAMIRLEALEPEGAPEAPSPAAVAKRIGKRVPTPIKEAPARPAKTPAKAPPKAVRGRQPVFPGDELGDTPEERHRNMDKILDFIRSTGVQPEAPAPTKKAAKRGAKKAAPEAPEAPAKTKRPTVKRAGKAAPEAPAKKAPAKRVAKKATVEAAKAAPEKKIPERPRKSMQELQDMSDDQIIEYVDSLEGPSQNSSEVVAKRMAAAARIRKEEGAPSRETPEERAVRERPEALRNRGGRVRPSGGGNEEQIRTADRIRARAKAELPPELQNREGRRRPPGKTTEQILEEDRARKLPHKPARSTPLTAEERERVEVEEKSARPGVKKAASKTNIDRAQRFDRDTKDIPGEEGALLRSAQRDIAEGKPLAPIKQRLQQRAELYRRDAEIERADPIDPTGERARHWDDLADAYERAADVAGKRGPSQGLKAGDKVERTNKDKSITKGTVAKRGRLTYIDWEDGESTRITPSRPGRGVKKVGEAEPGVEAPKAEKPRTLADLRKDAAALGVPGRSTMDREKLTEAIAVRQRHEGESDEAHKARLDELNARPKVTRAAPRKIASRTKEAAPEAAAPEAPAKATRPVVKRAAAKKAATKLADLTPEQRRQYTDLAPPEQASYRAFLRNGRSHDDALQAARDMVNARTMREANRAEREFKKAAPSLRERGTVTAPMPARKVARTAEDDVVKVVPHKKSAIKTAKAAAPEVRGVQAPTKAAKVARPRVKRAAPAPVAEVPETPTAVARNSKADYLPGGPKHLDLSPYVKDSDFGEVRVPGGSKLDHVPDHTSLIKDAQRRLDEGQTPGQVGRELQLAAARIRSSAVIRYGDYDRSALGGFINPYEDMSESEKAIRLRDRENKKTVYEAWQKRAKQLADLGGVLEKLQRPRAARKVTKAAPEVPAAAPVKRAARKVAKAAPEPPARLPRSPRLSPEQRNDIEPLNTYDKARYRSLRRDHIEHDAALAQVKRERQAADLGVAQRKEAAATERMRNAEAAKAAKAARPTVKRAGAATKKAAAKAPAKAPASGLTEEERDQARREIEYFRDHLAPEGLPRGAKYEWATAYRDAKNRGATEKAAKAEGDAAAARVESRFREMEKRQATERAEIEAHNAARAILPPGANGQVNHDNLRQALVDAHGPAARERLLDSLEGQIKRQIGGRAQYRDLPADHWRKIASGLGIKGVSRSDKATIKKRIIDQFEFADEARKADLRARKVEPRDLAKVSGVAKRVMDAAENDPHHVRRGGWGKGMYESDRHGGDLLGEHLAREQGFDQLPTVLTRDEFEQRRGKDMGLVLYRGVNTTGRQEQRGWGQEFKGKPASEVHDEFREGRYHMGIGSFGNGTYMTRNSQHAKGYSDLTEGSVARYGLAKDAKIAELPDLYNERDEWLKTLPADAPERKVFGDDIGRYAMSRGYDAIHVPRGSQALGTGPEGAKDQYVILNRGKVFAEAPGAVGTVAEARKAAVAARKTAKAAPETPAVTRAPRKIAERAAPEAAPEVAPVRLTPAQHQALKGIDSGEKKFPRADLQKKLVDAGVVEYRNGKYEVTPAGRNVLDNENKRPVVKRAAAKAAPETPEATRTRARAAKALRQQEQIAKDVGDTATAKDMARQAEKLETPAPVKRARKVAATPEQRRTEARRRREAEAVDLEAQRQEEEAIQRENDKAAAELEQMHAEEEARANAPAPARPKVTRARKATPVGERSKVTERLEAMGGDREKIRAELDKDQNNMDVLREVAQDLGLDDQQPKPALKRSIEDALAGSIRGRKVAAPTGRGIPEAPVKATRAEPNVPENMKDRVRPGGMLALAHIRKGDRVMVEQGSDGQWRPSDKISATPITLTSVRRTPQNGVAFVGKDDDGNEISVDRRGAGWMGQQTIRAGRPEGAATKRVDRDVALARVAAYRKSLGSFRDSGDEGEKSFNDMLDQDLRNGTSPAVVARHLRNRAQLYEHRANAQPRRIPLIESGGKKNYERGTTLDDWSEEQRTHWREQAARLRKGADDFLADTKASRPSKVAKAAPEGAPERPKVTRAKKVVKAAPEKVPRKIAKRAPGELTRIQQNAADSVREASESLRRESSQDEGWVNEADIPASRYLLKQLVDKNVLEVEEVPGRRAGSVGRQYRPKGNAPEVPAAPAKRAAKKAAIKAAPEAVKPERPTVRRATTPRKVSTETVAPEVPAKRMTKEELRAEIHRRNLAGEKVGTIDPTFTRDELEAALRGEQPELRGAQRRQAAKARAAARAAEPAAPAKATRSRLTPDEALAGIKGKETQAEVKPFLDQIRTRSDMDEVSRRMGITPLRDGDLRARRAHVLEHFNKPERPIVKRAAPRKISRPEAEAPAAPAKATRARAPRPFKDNTAKAKAWGAEHGYKGRVGGWIYDKDGKRTSAHGWDELYKAHSTEIEKWDKERLAGGPEAAAEAPAPAKVARRVAKKAAPEAAPEAPAKATRPTVRRAKKAIPEPEPVEVPEEQSDIVDSETPGKKPRKLAAKISPAIRKEPVPEGVDPDDYRRARQIGMSKERATRYGEARARARENIREANQLLARTRPGEITRANIEADTARALAGAEATKAAPERPTVKRAARKVAAALSRPFRRQERAEAKVPEAKGPESHAAVQAARRRERALQLEKGKQELARFLEEEPTKTFPAWRGVGSLNDRQRKQYDELSDDAKKHYLTERGHDGRVSHAQALHLAEEATKEPTPEAPEAPAKRTPRKIARSSTEAAPMGRPQAAAERPVVKRAASRKIAKPTPESDLGPRGVSRTRYQAALNEGMSGEEAERWAREDRQTIAAMRKEREALRGGETVPEGVPPRRYRAAKAAGLSDKDAAEWAKGRQSIADMRKAETPTQEEVHAQNQIKFFDRARSDARLAGRLNELLDPRSPASDKVIKHQIDSYSAPNPMANSLGVPDEDRDALQKAFREGGHEGLRRALRDFEQRKGITRVDDSGDVVAYDPERHKVVSTRSSVRPGERVLVMKAGHSATAPGNEDSTLVQRPEVTPIKGLANEAELRRRPLKRGPGEIPAPRKEAAAEAEKARIRADLKELSRSRTSGARRRRLQDRLQGLENADNAEAVAPDSIRNKEELRLWADSYRTNVRERGLGHESAQHEANIDVAKDYLAKRTAAKKTAPEAAPEAPAPAKTTRPRVTRAATKVAPAPESKELRPLADGTRRKNMTNVQEGDVVRGASGYKGNGAVPRKVVKVERDGNSITITRDDGSTLKGNANTAVWLGEAPTAEAPAAKRAARKVAAPEAVPETPATRSRRRKPGPFNPYEVYANSGEDEQDLRKRLDALELDQLRDIIAENGMDPSRSVSRSRDKQKLVDRIANATRDRTQKGRAFLDKETAQKILQKTAARRVAKAATPEAAPEATSAAAHKVGDRVQNEDGVQGRITSVNGDKVNVRWDNGILQRHRNANTLKSVTPERPRVTRAASNKVESADDVIANRGTVLRTPEHVGWDIVQHSGNKRWYILDPDGKLHKDGRVSSSATMEAAQRRLDRIDKPAVPTKAVKKVASAPNKPTAESVLARLAEADAPENVDVQDMLKGMDRSEVTKVAERVGVQNPGGYTLAGLRREVRDKIDRDSRSLPGEIPDAEDTKAGRVDRARQRIINRQAHQRRAEADGAAELADMLNQVIEARRGGSDPKEFKRAFRQRVLATPDQNNEHKTAGYDSLRKAFEYDSFTTPEQLETKLRLQLAKRGITFTSRPGAQTRFNPDLHRAVGEDIPDNADVEVLRPGLIFTDEDGTVITLRKPVVRRVGTGGRETGPLAKVPTPEVATPEAERPVPEGMKRFNGPLGPIDLPEGRTTTDAYGVRTREEDRVKDLVRDIQQGVRTRPDNIFDFADRHMSTSDLRRMARVLGLETGPGDRKVTLRNKVMREIGRRLGFEHREALPQREELEKLNMEQLKAKLPEGRRLPSAASKRELVDILMGDEDAPGDRHATLTPEMKSVKASVDAGTTDVRNLGGGTMGRVTLVQDRSGKKLIRKRLRRDWFMGAEEQTDAETLVSRLGREMGVDAPAVYQPTSREVYMDYVDGKLASRVTPTTMRAAVRTPEGRRLHLLDLITGNVDRHPGNFIINSEGKPVAIDNSLAFRGEMVRSAGGEVLPSTLHHQDPFRRHYKVQTGTYDREGVGNRDDAWAPTHPYSREELEDVRRKLEGIRPEFVKLNRQDWYDEAMGRLEALMTRAKSTGTSPMAGAHARDSRGAYLPDSPARRARKAMDRVSDKIFGAPVKPTSPRQIRAPLAPGEVLTGEAHITNGSLLTRDTGPEGVPVRNFSPALSSDYYIENGTAWRRNGITYIVEHDSTPEGLAAAQDAARLMERHHRGLPPSASRYQRSYSWMTRANPADADHAARYKLDGFVSRMSATHGDTFIWQPGLTISPEGSISAREVIESLNHEFGHNVDIEIDGVRISESPIWHGAAERDDPSKVIRLSTWRPTTHDEGPLHAVSLQRDPSAIFPGGVTKYGQSSAREDMAEAVRLYLQGRIGTAELLSRPGIASVIWFRDLFPERAAILDLRFPEVAQAQLAEINARRRRRR